MLADPGKNDTQRFWDTLEQMEKEAKVLQRCLDGYSRSNMLMHTILMLNAGILTKEDLMGFSETLQQQVSRALG